MKATNVLLSLMLLTASLNIYGQNNLPRLSPKSIVGQTIGYTKVEINYGSPGVKERSIWGELVPYGKVWRTGANEATTIDFDKDVIVEGEKVSAGKYSFFTIPGKESWTIIFNKVYDQWGAYKYDEKQDLIRFNVYQSSNHHVERLTFRFNYQDAYRSNVVLEWANIKVMFIIDTDLK